MSRIYRPPILPGTEELQRYPHSPGLMGVEHYGRQKGLYKVGADNETRIGALGYHVRRTGRYYIYVEREQKPATV